MPTYAYRCKACAHEFEIVQRIIEEPLSECPECKGELAKLLFPVGIVFKGSGFHVNDYPSSKASTTDNGKKAEPSAEPSSESKSEPKSEPKPESKPQTAASKS